MHSILLHTIRRIISYTYNENTQTQTQNKKNLLRQSIVYSLEVSTWEFSFSLDFYFGWIFALCHALCRQNASLLFHHFFSREKNRTRKNCVPHKPDRMKGEKASKQTFTNCISGNRAETSLNTFVIFCSFSMDEKKKSREDKKCRCRYIPFSAR